MVFPAYNFILFNLIHKVSHYYGSHPWHWYLTQGVFVVTLTHLPLACIGAYSGVPILARQKGVVRQAHVVDTSLAYIIIWQVEIPTFRVIVVYSCLSHKEFRFIFPLLPLFCIYAGIALYSICNPLPPVDKPQRKAKSRTRFVMTILIALNAIPACYLSLIHQRGVMRVMRYISETPVDGVVFLMPCHSTPFYSAVHKDVYMRFLTCEPPIMHPQEFVCFKKGESQSTRTNLMSSTATLTTLSRDTLPPQTAALESLVSSTISS